MYDSNSTYSSAHLIREPHLRFILISSSHLQSTSCSRTTYLKVCEITTLSIYPPSSCIRKTSRKYTSYILCCSKVGSYSSYTNGKKNNTAHLINTFNIGNDVIVAILAKDQAVNDAPKMKARVIDISHGNT